MQGKQNSHNKKRKYDVFLSHLSKDKPQVEEIAERLEDQEQIKPFLDKWHLVPGEPWQEALEKALDESVTCAVFLGPDGVGPWENEEMRSALDDRVKDKMLRVIPVLLPGANPQESKTLPRFLRRLTWVDFSSGIDDEEAFRRLVAGIKGRAPGRERLRTVKKQKLPPVSSLIVQSWFEAVINPILRQLRMELPYLEKKKWTWQVFPRRLDPINSTSRSLAQAEDTLHQFLSFYPHVDEMLSRYEQGVQELFAACYALHEAIEESEDLKAVFELVKADDAPIESGEPLNRGLNNFSDNGHLENIIHYIVISAEELPLHNGHRFIWAKYRQEFLALLDKPSIDQKRRQMNQAGESLLVTVRELITLLVETKTPLSLAFGVPV